MFTRKLFTKPWWYFSEYKWWYEDYYQNVDDNYKYNNADYIYSGTGKLDKEGRFDFTYAIKEDFKAKNSIITGGTMMIIKPMKPTLLI